MKRDLDFVREIMLAIEARKLGEPLELSPGHDAQVTKYHFDLLREAGFLESDIARDSVNLGAARRSRPAELTWEGHDFLDTIRDPEIWKKTKDGARRAGGFSVDLLKELAKGFLKQMIKEKTGIEI